MFNEKAAFIILKWTGCTPGANIGTMYVTTAISIEPVAKMRNILQVTPRGSYEGTFRVLKQCRKRGIPLEFLSPEDAQDLFVDSFT